MGTVILGGLAVLIIFLYIFSFGKIEENEEQYDEEFLDDKKAGGENERRN